MHTVKDAISIHLQAIKNEASQHAASFNYGAMGMNTRPFNLGNIALQRKKYVNREVIKI